LSHRFRRHLVGWFVAAVFVATSLLPGVMDEGVLAAGGTPALKAAGTRASLLVQLMYAPASTIAE
jgi:hypothetical protein